MYFAGGFKGKADKGKGKGKSKGKVSPEGGKGHALPRTRLSAEKFSGTVIAWKGKYGWIQPSEEIEHEKAKLHSGSLFFGINDIEGGEALEAGAPVEFHICEDDSGLGAEEVVQTGDVSPAAAAAAAAKGKGKATAAAAGGKSAAAGKNGNGACGAKGGYGNGKGKDASWGAGASWAASPSPAAWGGKGGAKSWGPTPFVADSGKWGGGGKAAGGKFGGKSFTSGGKDDKGKGKGKDGNKGKGHLLPRSRITAEKFTGTVTDWKGKYGWIQPAEEISHEKAGKHQGRLFVSKDDLEGGIEELTAGATVEFHIWEDSSGLGAEDVVQY